MSTHGEEHTLVITATRSSHWLSTGHDMRSGTLERDGTSAFSVSKHL